MKPTFALNLTNERVGLLHRTGRGWLQVGEVAFDTPDLSEALAYLRRTALGLSPNGLTTKLVIPNSQILYCDVEAPGPDEETRRRQIRTGLAGRTPYDPADLVFDWRGKGTMVKVAVVARETLTEAEAFAVEHRFGPVSFVALPEPSQFKGEPFFGMTEAAKTTLPASDTVEPERDAMTIVTRNLPLADLPPEPEDRPAKRSDRAEKVSSDPLTNAVEKLKSPPPATAAPDPLPTPSPMPPELPPAVPPPEVPPPAPTPEPELPKPEPIPVEEPQQIPPTRFEERPSGRLSARTAAAVAAGGVVDEAPFAEVEDVTSVTGSRIDAGIDDDLPPAPSKAAQMAFASRRSDEMRAAPPSAVSANGKSFGGLPGAARDDGPAKRPTPPLRNDAQVTAPTIPGSKKRKAAPSTPPPAVAAAAAQLAKSGGTMGQATKPLTRPGGTFGAKPLPKKGKPRYLGLILTGILLVVLAIIAALASSDYFGQSTTTELDTSAYTTPMDVPAIDDEMAADQQDGVLPSDTPVSDTPGNDETALAPAEEPADPDPAATETSQADPAATAPAVTDLTTVPDALAADTAQDIPAVLPDAEIAIAPDPAPPVVPTAPDAAIATAPEATPSAAPTAPDATETAAAPAPAPVEVATAPDLGLATVAAGPEPRAADLPPDEIFLATADTPPDFQDALTLPVPALTSDTSPTTAAPPPPFGTLYQFDAAGLIRPTEEGIMAPDGYMLFAGAPPIVPPARSAAALAAIAAAIPAAPAAPAVPTDDPAAAALAATAAASLAAPAAPVETAPPVADPAMAAFRPRPRPEGLAAPAPVQNADDARLNDDEATRVAMLRPRARPDAVSSSASNALVGAAAASLTAQANAAVEAALASAAETGNVMTLAVSRRPAARPKDMSRAVNAAVAAAVRTTEPDPESAGGVAANDASEGDAEPELVSAAPRIPTKTTVAKQATYANAINLSKINLIGVYGTPSKRYALVRLASGRYKKVTVGDSVDGGRVEAITASEVRYQKSGRLLALKMPRT